MFGARWRWNATRALCVLRHEHGRRVPARLQRARADDRLAGLADEHPLVRQTLHDCLHEALDAARMHDVLRRMERGEIRLHARDTSEPSPFADEVLSATPYAFQDDAPPGHRRSGSSLRAVSAHGPAGGLDADAIARVEEQVRPAPRTADELHEALLALVAMPIEEAWTELLEELLRTGRAARLGPLAFALDHARLVEAIYVGAPRRTVPPYVEASTPPRDDAVLALVRGHAEVSGPFTPAGLAQRLGLDAWEIDLAVARLEAEGQVRRGRFTSGRSPPPSSRGQGRTEGPVAPAEDERQVCDTRILARIQRATLEGPLPAGELSLPLPPDFQRYLLERHGLAAGARGHGLSGLRDAVAMLQGWIAPAASWENELLAPRVSGYRGEWLDDLVRAGELSWSATTAGRPRTSDPPAPLRAVPGATPMVLSGRRELGWLLEALHRPGEAGDRGLSDDELADRVASQLLLRYGIVSREIAARESFRVPWPELVAALRRREARGAVRGGTFVAGLHGEQYALADAIEGLARVQREPPAETPPRLAPCDPLNLTGLAGMSLGAPRGAGAVGREEAEASFAR